MPTSIASLDTSQYVRINAALNPLILQAHGDAVRVAISELKPALANTAYHLLTGADAPLALDSINTNVWVLATTPVATLIVTEMSSSIGKNWLIEVQKGNVPGHSIVTKFGFAALTSSPTPVTHDLLYNTPTSAAALEFVSDNVNDTALGTGAKEITYIGLNSSWVEVTGTIATNGITAVPLPDNLTRLYRWYVSKSGAYADLATPSYAGLLTIQASGGGAVWSTIAAVFPYPAQSEIGVYSVPAGKRAYLISKHLFTDANKLVDVYLLVRENADSIVAPFTGVRKIVEREIGLAGNVSVAFEALKGPYQGPADLGFVGSVASGTADVSIEFDMLVIDDGY